VIALLASDSLSVRKRAVQPSAQYCLKALESSAAVVQSASDRTGAKLGCLGISRVPPGLRLWPCQLSSASWARVRG
jgi:hypothetical protein